MPAPDLSPPLAHAAKGRAIAVHLLPRLYRAEAFSGCVAVVVDVLRASTTISSALANGAVCVVPVLSVDEARAAAVRPGMKGAVLGGERGGVRIEGFDLGNSPAEYTTERVNGRRIIFTTTNGTAALLHSGRASRILVGSFSNLGAVCAAVADDPRPVHIVCAGTRDEVSLDDCFVAGAMVERLMTAGRRPVSDDSALICLCAWRDAMRPGGPGLVEAMRASRGGKGLVNIGFERDVEFCAALDSTPVVPVYDAERGEITASTSIGQGAPALA